MEGAIHRPIGTAVLIVVLRVVVTEVNTCLERQASEAESEDSTEAISEAEVMFSEITPALFERTSGRTISFHLVVKRNRCIQINYWHFIESWQKSPPLRTDEVWM
jgi:hypothetical protein